jgi:hypothetical protein
VFRTLEKKYNVGNGCEENGRGIKKGVEVEKMEKKEGARRRGGEVEEEGY